MDFAALGLTLRLAALTTLCLLAVATPLAAWLSGVMPSAATVPSNATATRGRTLARRLTQAAVALPLVLPPTVLGFYLLMGLGPATWLGRSIIHLLGHSLAFTFWGLLIGSMIYSLPFAVQPLVVAFAAVDRAAIEVASTLGASPWSVFRRIVLPLSKASFLTAAVLTFAHTVGEFGVVLMVGGDIPGVTRTLSISIFDQVQELNYTAANRTALTLIALSFAALLAVYWRGAQQTGNWTLEAAGQKPEIATK
jgi:molybdate transport system permease protein